MKVVLFCGGLGTRLREYTGEIPKPMVKIGPRPILWHLMKYYAHFGHKDFVLCLGYKAEVIKQYFLNYEEWISNDFTLVGGGKEVRLENSDIADWNITFVDTGLHANIGQRLVAARKHVAGEEMFLANYSDGLTDMDLPSMIENLRASDAVGSFLAVRPSQSFHLVDLEPDGRHVKAIRPVRESNLLLNGGYFAFRSSIFDYIHEGDELVEAPFARLMGDHKLIAHRGERFWCMDTFKEQQELSDLYNSGSAPWELWKPRQGAARR